MLSYRAKAETPHPDKIIRGHDIRDLRPAPFPYADKIVRHLRREGGASDATALRCEYAVGKVAAELWAAGVVTEYGIICSVVQSIVPFAVKL